MNFSYSTRKEIYLRDEGRCSLCGKPLHINKERCMDNDYAQLDHIKPKSLGGSNKKDNLRLICKSCNSARQNYSGQNAIELYKNRLRDSVISDLRFRLFVDDIETGALNKEGFEELKRELQRTYEDNLEMLNTLIILSMKDKKVNC